MKHTMLDLNKMSLTQMTFEEMLTIDGGNFWHWLAAGVCAVVGTVIALATGAFWVGAAIAVVGGGGLGIWAFLEEGGNGGN